MAYQSGLIYYNHFWLKLYTKDEPIHGMCHSRYIFDWTDKTSSKFRKDILQPYQQIK